MTDLSKCHCSAPGLCPVFKTHMGTNPPDWKWCQKASKEDRESYHKIRKELIPSNTQQLLEKYKTLDYDPKYFYLYFLMHSRKIHDCKLASYAQDQKFEKIINLSEQENPNKNFDDVEILVLSHKQDQLDNLPDKPYLKKTNLNKIDAGKYSGNEWAESRAYVSNTSLFSESVKYKGTVTASWNNKYEYARIEDFENWPNSKILINSKPEDNIVLCADVYCPCCWVRITPLKSVLSIFFKEEINTLGYNLLNSLKITLSKHTRVPFGYQFIAHKKVFDEYCHFLKTEKVLEKVENFVNENEKLIRKGTFIADEYHKIRINAYVMEMIGCYWFAKKDYLYIPNVRRNDNWYKTENVKNRIKKWDTTT